MRRIGAQMAVIGLAACCGLGVARGEDTTSADKTFIADSTQDSMAEIAVAKLALGEEPG